MQKGHSSIGWQSDPASRICQKLKANGNLLMAGAHLTADEKMNGSTMFLQFETESGIEEYLSTEPYIQNGV
ncbi:MAG: hypothetical protein IPH28_23240 [Cytophagaceae bacterium]|nr:hypothetical protein [Cytophagaceae bacterium]